MLGIINNKLNKGELRKSEAKIAKVIVDDPEAVLGSSISRLAHAAAVSEPSVNRFCTHLGFKGFPDFKIQLAQSIAQGVMYAGNNVQQGDSTEDLIAKIFDTSIATIKMTKDHLDTHEVEQAIDTLAQAKKIDFYGLGASGSVALDAQHKFFRLNIPVNALIDFLMQRMAAAVMHTGDVVVLISNTGRTQALVEVAQIALDAGATVIGITTGGTPLARLCNIVLDVDASDDTINYTPTTSRLAHLVIIDILATGVALKRGKGFQGHLKRVKNALIGTRIAE